MARSRSVSYRDPITTNINAGWIKLGEIDGTSSSVSYNGIFTQFMNATRSRNVILDNAYNRVGVGIAKNATKYYVCFLFKAVKVV
jgi:uncharacterized protein YkwD